MPVVGHVPGPVWNNIQMHWKGVTEWNWKTELKEWYDDVTWKGNQREINQRELKRGQLRRSKPCHWSSASATGIITLSILKFKFWTESLNQIQIVERKLLTNIYKTKPDLSKFFQTSRGRSCWFLGQIISPIVPRTKLEKLWEMMRKIVEQIWEKNCTKGLPQKFIFYLWLKCDIWRKIEVEFWHNL